jgi:very-short-patch-repair endonuclease
MLEAKKQRNIKSGVVFLPRVTGQKVGMSRHLRKNMTPAEVLLWTEIRNRQLGEFKFRRQQIIHGYIADFYCESAKLAVEVDGSVHDKADQKEIDAHKEAVFRNRGIKVIRVSNNAVISEIDQVMKTILEILHTRVSVSTGKLIEKNVFPPSPGGEGAGDEVIDKSIQSKEFSYDP